jgi:CRISPR-associated endonuclease/helicase Cas3
MGRITGPEAQEDRLAATARRLILATPTVDIGYNFIKQNKQRQNVDFVIFDVRYGDELVQRLGRAGRVLGKPETTTPSRAVALLSQEAANALAVYDGQTLSRAEFAQLITECDHLPAKHTLTGYIRTYAITESFWPIYQFGKMLPPDLQNEVDDLFERIRNLFAPHSRWTPRGLGGFFRKMESRRQWLQEKQIRLNKDTAEHVSDWLAWLNSSPVEDRINPAGLLPHLEHLLADKPQQQGLRDFVESQLEVTNALFSFRDSFQGPTAVVYDRRRLLSSQMINAYDLFHLIRNYKLSLPLSRTQFEQTYQASGLQGDFYFSLLEFRDPKLNLELIYHSDDDPADFERKWCNAPVALKGIHLQVRNWGGDVVAGELDETIITALTAKALPMLIVPSDSIGAMRSKLRGTNLRSYPLNVYFSDGTVNEGYKALLGTAAFMGYAELKGHFLMKERLKPEAIII